MNLKDRITVNILNYCKDNKISELQLAQKLHKNVMKTRLMFDLNIKSRRFSFSDLEKVANALEVDPLFLINYERERKVKDERNYK